MKFRHVLFQAALFSTAPRLGAAVLASVATFALVNCGGGNGSLNSALPPPQADKLSLPDGHQLADWLNENPEGTISVPAGENLVLGGLRFECPVSGSNCSVMVARAGDTVTATSTGGMVMVSIVKPTVTKPTVRTPTRTLGGSGVQTLKASWDDNIATHFPWIDRLNVITDHSVWQSLSNGESYVFRRVRFTCMSPACEVRFQRRGSKYEVSRQGNVIATPHTEASGMKPGIAKGWATDHVLCDKNSASCSVTTNNKIKVDIFTLTEDKNAKIHPNYGWSGKRYTGTIGGQRDMIEAIIYTNADDTEDTSYVSYGTWLRIPRNDSARNNRSWTADAASFRSSGATLGLGALSGRVTYRGSAAGYYAIDGKELEEGDAGRFTARATLNADLGESLSISGTINGIIGEDGKQRNWSVKLNESSFTSRGGSNKVREASTIWTIDGKPEKPDLDRKWTGHAAENGNSIFGSFEAVYGRNGSMVGAFGAEKR